MGDGLGLGDGVGLFEVGVGVGDALLELVGAGCGVLAHPTTRRLALKPITAGKTKDALITNPL
ncbi:unannotated protein [freshwater metagenome]|uniref:Unannotated protein n=1 Tax=freshwater metagenome TaxID=449393 RepID=A0A6J7IRW9_9ZZZZ|nr:hypothetical protein [Actinomycetota bacterium]